MWLFSGAKVLNRGKDMWVYSLAFRPTESGYIVWVATRETVFLFQHTGLIRCLSYQRLAPVKKLTIPDPVLQTGSSGPQVVALQDALKLLNIDVGTSDGSFGSKTASGIKELQTRKPNLTLTEFIMKNRETCWNRYSRLNIF